MESLALVYNPRWLARLTDFLDVGASPALEHLQQSAAETLERAQKMSQENLKTALTAKMVRCGYRVSCVLCEGVLFPIVVVCALGAAPVQCVHHRDHERISNPSSVSHARTSMSEVRYCVVSQDRVADGGADGILCVRVR